MKTSTPLYALIGIAVNQSTKTAFLKVTQGNLDKEGEAVCINPPKTFNTGNHSVFHSVQLETTV